MQNLIDRRALAVHYREKYGIKVDSRTVERLTEKQLLIKLETRCQIAKENNAAIRIQAIARKVIFRNKFLKLLDVRHKAASRLQKAWRRSRNKNDLVYIVKAFKNMHATTIQRYMRGYHVTQ